MINEWVIIVGSANAKEENENNIKEREIKQNYMGRATSVFGHKNGIESEKNET